MPETLTESFCERCGTRFTFDPPPKPRTLGKLRLLSRGLKSYVLDDGSSFGDVMEHARSDDEQRRTNAQLDRFHDAFKFCMSCRQYTCGTCWNTDAGRCLSCAPVDEPEPVAAVPEPIRPADVVPLEPEEPPEPTLPAPAAELVGAAAAEPAVPEPTPAPVPEPRPEVRVASTNRPDEGAVDLLARLGIGPEESHRSTPFDRSAFGHAAAWTRRVDPTVADRAAATRATDSLPAAESPAPATPDEPVAEADRSMAVAAVPVTTSADTPVTPVEPAPAAPPPAPEPQPPSEPVWWIVAPEGQAKPRTDTGVQPTWATAPPRPAAPAPAPATRQVRPLADSAAWPPMPPAPADPPVSTPAAAPHTRVGPADAVWAASSRDVLNRPGSGAQACVACGLALSAAARFCRRCGSAQH